jgi:hypothetical protein
MNKFAHVAAFGCALAMFGCATNIVPVATGGSRADATVELSYEYGQFQQPVVDMRSAQMSAEKRCAVWGYTGADAFGGAKTLCEGANSLGCTRTVVTVQYQCTGTGVGGTTMVATPIPAQAVMPASAQVGSQRACTQQEAAQKRIAIQNGYTMIPNCQ